MACSVVLKKTIFEDLNVYGNGGHLGNVTWLKYINFLSPLLEGCLSNLNEIGPVVSMKKPFGKVDAGCRTREGQWWLPSYKLPWSPLLRGAKNMTFFIFFIFYQFIILSSLQEKLSTELIIIGINFQYCDKLPLTDPIPSRTQSTTALY